MEKSTLTKALETLETAAGNDKNQLMELLKGKYESLREVLIDGKDGMAQAINNATQRAVEAATRAKEIAEVKAKKIAATVDESVHTNPWACIGVAAAFGILVGYVLGKNK